MKVLNSTTDKAWQMKQVGRIQVVDQEKVLYVNYLKTWQLK